MEYIVTFQDLSLQVLKIIRSFAVKYSEGVPKKRGKFPNFGWDYTREPDPDNAGGGRESYNTREILFESNPDEFYKR